MRMDCRICERRLTSFHAVAAPSAEVKRPRGRPSKAEDAPPAGYSWALEGDEAGDQGADRHAGDLQPAGTPCKCFLGFKSDL